MMNSYLTNLYTYRHPLLTHDPLGHQHVVQPHELRVGRAVVLHVPQAEDRPLLDLAQHLEQRRLHPVAGQRVLARLQ